MPLVRNGDGLVLGVLKFDFLRDFLDRLFRLILLHQQCVSLGREFGVGIIVDFDSFFMKELDNGIHAHIKLLRCLTKSCALTYF